VELGLAVAVVAVGAGLLRGGSLEALASTRFAATAFLLAGFGLQIAASLWPGERSAEVSLIILVTSNLLVGIFLVANRHLPGVLIGGAGLLLNLAVIVFNGAMPVSRSALSAAGASTSASPSGFKHEVAGDQTLMPWLGDVIAIPGAGLILSIGDVLLAIGIGILAYGATTSRIGASEAG
jgi:hypothetical protein